MEKVSNRVAKGKKTYEEIGNMIDAADAGQDV